MEILRIKNNLIKKMEEETKIKYEKLLLGKKDRIRMASMLLSDKELDSKNVDKIRRSMSKDEIKSMNVTIEKIVSRLNNAFDSIINDNNNEINNRIEKEKDEVETPKPCTERGVSITLEPSDMMKLFNGECVNIEFGELKEIGLVKINSKK